MEFGQATHNIPAKMIMMTGNIYDVPRQKQRKHFQIPENNINTVVDLFVCITTGVRWMYGNKQKGKKGLSIGDLLTDAIIQFQHNTYEILHRRKNNLDSCTFPSSWFFLYCEHKQMAVYLSDMGW
jgi:hypothetical protein